MRPAKLLLIGNFGAGNLGDDAILAGLLEDLKAIRVQAEIDVMLGDQTHSSPELYSKLSRIPFPRIGLRSRLKSLFQKGEKMKDYDLAIFGGGALFTDAESVKAPWLWSKLADILRTQGIPYIFYGQSLGPLKRRIARNWSKRAIQGARALHFRDQTSLDYLQKDLKISLKAHFSSDLAWSWLSSQKAAVHEKKTQNFLLCLRSWPGLQQNVIKKIQNLCHEFAKEHALNLVLVSMDHSRKDEDSYLRPNSIQEAYDLISNARFLCTVRLHPGLFALQTKTPFLALSYSNKVEGFYRSLNCDHAYLSLENFDSSQFKKALDESFKRDPIKLNLRPLIEANRAFLARELAPWIEDNSEGAHVERRH